MEMCASIFFNKVFFFNNSISNWLLGNEKLPVLNPEVSETCLIVLNKGKEYHNIIYVSNTLKISLSNFFYC